MKAHEAVQAARAYVKQEYDYIPPVAMVTYFTRVHLPEANLRLQSWTVLDQQVREENVVLANVPAEELPPHPQWLIAFRMSWDTDARDMPEPLMLVIDDLDSSVRKVDY